MASGSLVSRVLGVVRTAMLGACVGGMTAASSAFQVANNLPNTLFMLLNSGVLTALLIPQITRALAREDGGKRSIDALLTASFGLILIVTVVATVLAAPLVWAFSLRGDVAQLATAFAYLCLPQIFFYAAYAIWSQVLNVQGKFGLVMWTPALANLVQIAGMAWFLAAFPAKADPAQWTPLMIVVLAGTSTLGIVVQALTLLPALRRIGYRWRPNFTVRGHGFRSSAKVATLMLVAVIFAQVGGWLTQAAIGAVWQHAHDAGHLVPGPFVYYQAFTIFMVPHGIITVSILTGLLPRMTKAWQRGDVADLRGDVDRGLRLPLIAMVPITCAAVALALPGCHLLNPALDVGSVLSIAITFSLMALGLLPYAVVGLQQRYSTAREDGGTYLVFQLIVTGIQVAVAGLILVLPWQFGVVTVAAGQTLSNAIAALIFLLLAQRQLGGLPLRRLGALTGRLLAASVPAATFTGLTVVLIQGALDFSLATSLLELIVGGAVFGVTFLALARYVHIAEINAPVDALARRLIGRPVAS